jgi:hypothetical protein
VLLKSPSPFGKTTSRIPKQSGLFFVLSFICTSLWFRVSGVSVTVGRLKPEH